MDDTREAFTGYETRGGLFNPGLIKGADPNGNDIVDFGVGGQMRDIQSLLLNNAQGLFHTQGGNAQLAGDIGAQFLGGLGSSNPLETQQALYNQLSPQMIDQQKQDFFDMEGRLFGQGRIGSTGGTNQLGELYSQQQDAQQRLLFDTFGQAQQAQAQQANIGAQMSQLDPQLQGMFQGVGNDALASALGIDSAAQQALRTATMIGGAGRVPEYGNGGPNLGGGMFTGLGQGLQAGGLNMIGNGINNWMSPGFTGGNPYARSPGNPHG
jgi:hypothetical protein